MCGVFGYVGQRDALEVCLKGLEQLEYRGYDSTGIAGIKKGSIAVCKRVGKLACLKADLTLSSLELAIAHTRWATHGKVNNQNAHPHLDNTLSIALVHNGIIENYDQLRDQLKKEGVVFSSETDTEVVVNLIQKNYQGDLVVAVHKTLSHLKGSFALALIHKDHPEEIIATARECPLSIAFNSKKTESIISSDANCFFGLDLNILFLHQNEIARLKKGSIEVFDQHLSKIEKQTKKIQNKINPPSKEGFDHFMLKEILQQPSLIKKNLSKRVYNHHLPTSPYSKNINHLELKNAIHFEELDCAFNFFENIQKIWIIGCGTSSHAALICSLFLEDHVSIFSSCEIGSEARYRNPMLSKETLVIAISQSGETADTLAALREAKKHGCKTLGICNVQNSALVRETDHCLFLHAEPEISVCSTKAFTSQITILSLLSLYLGQMKGSLNKQALHTFLVELKKIPSQMQQVIGRRDELEKLAEKYSQYENFFFMGRHYMLPTCMEAALKLKEISYVNANGYAAGELKHGPIALLSPDFPVVAFCANHRTHEKILSNLTEVKARGAPVLAFAPKNLPIIASSVDDVFLLPPTIDALAPFTSTVAGQLFAYYIAKKRGCDIDQPRNLAKSVTVE